MALACSKHGVDVRLYCETCSDYMCSKCLASGTHKEHTFHVLSVMFDTEHAKMREVQEQTRETKRV